MESNNRSKTYKGISIQTFITITLGVLGILYFAVMSRLLSKTDFGYFAIITAVTSILTSLSEAGLGSAVIQSRNSSKSFVQTAWTLSFILGSIFCILLFCFADFLSTIMVGSDVLSLGYRIMSFSLILYAVNGVGRAVIIKKLNFLKYGVFDIVAYTLSSIVGVYLAYNGYGFYAVVVAMLLHQTFLGVQIIISIRDILSIKIQKNYVREIINYGGWLTSSVIVRNITDQADKLITTHWISVPLLGAYNRPTGLIYQITGNINGIFDTILFPILSGINDDPKKIVSAYEKSVSLIILFSIILSTGFILASELIISIFLGEEWLYLANIFEIVSLVIVFLSYNRLADCFFRSIGIVKTYFMSRCYILVCTCVSIYLGCQFGIVGLAIGLVVSKIAAVIIKIILLTPYIPLKRFSFYKESLKSWGVPLILFFVCYIIKKSMPFGNFVSIVLFVSILGIICCARPQLLGSIFYENLYLVVVNKLRKNK